MTLEDVIHDVQFDYDSPLIVESKYYETYELIPLSRGNSNYLKIFNTNIRSISKNYTQFEAFLGELESLHFSFDILSFTETWLDCSLENSIHFQNYIPAFKHKHPNKEGGGLALYVKDDIQFKVRHDLNFPIDKQNLFDAIFIEIIPNEKHSRSLVLGNLYRTPSFNSVNEFNHDISHLIEKLQSENKDIVLLGDLNINLIQSSTHRDLRIPRQYAR